MLLNIDNLITDLKLLKDKYKISIHEKDNYRPDPEDGEVYDGTDQYFVIDGERYYVKTVEQIIKEVFE